MTAGILCARFMRQGALLLVSLRILLAASVGTRPA